MDDVLARAAATLAGATEVALACHVNPDPDALGSMLGLSTYLRERGVRTVCSYPNDPFDPPRWLDLLPGHDALVHPREFPKAPAVMVTCDAASMDRLAMLAPAATKAGTLVWIDHHRSNAGLGTIPLIDPDASSTCEMVARLIAAMGGGMSAATAAALYVGLMTDTGRFQYEAVRPETLRLAAELRTFDFDHARLSQALYEDNSAAYLRLLGTALHRMRVEDGLAWTALTRADLEEHGVDVGETDDLIDVVRTAREADVAAVVKQQRDGRFKVSLRSRGEHDVAAVAGVFGGGGHRLAAGYTSKEDLEGTIAALRAAIVATR